MTPKQLYNDYLFQWLDEDNSSSSTELILEKHSDVENSEESASEQIICYYCSIYRDHPGGSNVIATHTKYIKKKGTKPVCEFCYNWKNT